MRDIEDKKKIAIYPGSFDPVTFGHIDIIKRAALLFDYLIVLVTHNPTKPGSFTTEERKFFLKTVAEKIIKAGNIEIDTNDGLLVDYFKRRNADVIVKGLRALTDFEYEFQMALVNKDLCTKAETVFLAADVSNTFLSSSMVKQIAVFDGDISPYVPEIILNDIKNRLRRNDE